MQLFHKPFKYTLNRRNSFDLLEDNGNFDYGKLFITLFGKYFSQYIIILNMNNEGVINCLIKRYALGKNQIIRQDHANDDDFFKVDYTYCRVLLILKKELFISFTDFKVEIMYSSNIPENEINELIKLVTDFKIVKTTKRKFHMIQHSDGFFFLADFDIKPIKMDIDTHYNDDFKNVHDLIVSSLETKNKNGLILLHGNYGTGKTYYLRYLTSIIDRPFIYFPLNMVEALNSPDFLPFITQQPNSVLILEDCESLLVSRENFNHTSALSNLLNLGDGFLSDALSINVICTFNASIKKIDDAILRKGRLLARYEFKELELPKARTLAQKIDKNVEIDHPMTVSDIYNLDEKSFENKQSKAIGFKAA